jgi:hypothetical protein
MFEICISYAVRNKEFLDTSAFLCTNILLNYSLNDAFFTEQAVQRPMEERLIWMWNKTVVAYLKTLFQ